MSRPLLLDLFAGSGGSAVGYYRAGFDVVGVDVADQPNYPFRLIHDDISEWHHIPMPEQYAVIHASPPCQAYSTTRTLHSAKYPKLIEHVRGLLRDSGRPYVIENVVGAPMQSPVSVCGSSFGLGVRRHRLFESNFWLSPSICAHHLQPHPIDVTGGGPSKKARTDGRGGRSRKPKNLAEAREAMGIDWMSRQELNEAVPPAFTDYVGRQLLHQLERVA